MQIESKAILKSFAKAETLTDIRIKLIDNIDDLQQIRSAWDSLVNASQCNNVFSSFIWSMTSFKCYQNLKPWVIVAYRGDAVVGLLPIAIESAKRTIRFANRLADYHDTIVAKEDDEVADALLNYLVDTLPKGYSLLLQRLRPDGNLYRSLKSSFTEEKLAISRGVSQTTLYAQLPDTYDFYLQSRSKLHRKNIRRCLRNAARDQVVVKQLTPANFEAEKLPDLFLKLHLLRFGEASGLDNQAHKSFIKQAIPQLFTEELIKVFALFDKEQIVGIDLLPMGRKSICAWNGGFDPNYQYYSPGYLMFAAEFEYAITQGLKEFDFLRGSQAYKERWVNGERSIQAI